MPDTGDNGNLDSRIRELVARAVADAPRPPDIDPSVLPESEPKHDHHRGWWLGGGAAILAAAALISALLLVGNADDKVSTPGTPPTVATNPAPTTAIPTTVPPSASLGAVLTAGPRGVVLHQGGERRTLTTEPMTIALDAGDGRVIVARETGPGARRPLVLGDDGSLAPLFDYALWPNDVQLHDIEVVDGRRLLLYSEQKAMDDPEAADETLFVIDLDTQERTRVARHIGGWEFGTDRLHLSRTGLIVGQASGEASHWIKILAVPDSPAADTALPTAADLGLEEFFSDCNDCPTGFTVAPDGGTIAWVDDGGLISMALAPEIGQPERIAEVPGYVKDLDLSDSAAIVSIFQVPERPPLLVPLDAGDAVRLEGTTATFGPTG